MKRVKNRFLISRLIALMILGLFVFSAFFPAIYSLSENSSVKTESSLTFSKKDFTHASGASFVPSVFEVEEKEENESEFDSDPYLILHEFLKLHHYFSYRSCFFSDSPVSKSLSLYKFLCIFRI